MRTVTVKYKDIILLCLSNISSCLSLHNISSPTLLKATPVYKEEQHSAKKAEGQEVGSASS